MTSRNDASITRLNEKVLNGDSTVKISLPVDPDEENLAHALVAIADYAMQQANYQKPVCELKIDSSIATDEQERLLAELKLGGVEVLSSVATPAKSLMHLHVQKTKMGIEAKLTKGKNSKSFILTGSLRVHETGSLIRAMYGFDQRIAEINNIMKRLRGQGFRL